MATNTAKYFDGKSSKSHPVEINYNNNSIHISGIENSSINSFWKLDACTIESLNSGNILLISYGDFPKESIQIHQDQYPNLSSALIEQQNSIAQSYHKLNRFNPITVVALSSFFVVSTVFLYITYLSPWVGEQAVRIIPESMEIKMGKSIANNFTSMAEIDTLKSEWLNDFFEECDYESDYPIELTYLKGDVVNAFAAPGGQIVVYEDMLQLTENPDELAGLLAHELAHVNQRHSMKSLAKSLSAYLILSVITGDVGGISGLILEQANNVKEMANSRTYEREADEKGLGYMVESHIDPNGMVQLFENLLAYSENPLDSLTLSTFPALDSLQYLPTEEYLEILSSHPTSQQRITYLTEIIIAEEFTIEINTRRDSLWQLLKEN